MNDITKESGDHVASTLPKAAERKEYTLKKPLIQGNEEIAPPGKVSLTAAQAERLKEAGVI